MERRAAARVELFGVHDEAKERMMRPIWAATGLLLLQGCNSDGEAPAGNVAAVEEPAIDYPARVAAMAGPARDALFLRAILDAGQECQGVNDARAFGDMNGDPAWSARCRNGGEWLVVIGRNGGAQVTSLEEARAAGVVVTR